MIGKQRVRAREEILEGKILNILGRLTKKTVRDIKSGELITRCLERYGPYTAIVVSVDGGSFLEYVVRSDSTTDFRPKWQSQKNVADTCISYGCDWVLEIVPDVKTVVGDKRTWNVAGGIRDKGDALLLKFGGAYVGNEKFLQLDTMAEVEMDEARSEQQCISYGAWNIWAKEGSKKAREAPIVSWPNATS